MELAPPVIGAIIVAASLGLVARWCLRLLRWARSSRGGAHVLGAILTEVTQAGVVQEAKRGQKLSEKTAGDPPSE
jgi:hypothetical protein